MRRYALVEFGEDLQTIDSENPVPTGPEVLVRVRRCGVCHSDLHIKDGYFDLGGGKKFRMSDRGMVLPMALGHEILGEVVGVGPEADPALVGQTMLVHPWIGCENCAACQSGRENDCTKMKAIGIARDGGYASHVLVPHYRFLVDVEGLDLSIAAPLACSGLTVYSALKKLLPIEDDGWLAVLGAGGLGLSAVSIAKALGAEKIVVVDLDDDKIEAAKALGADAGLNPRTSENPVAALQEITGGRLFRALDTVGAEPTSSLAVGALIKTGVLVIVGLHGGTFSMPLPMIPQKAMTIRGSYVGSCSELRELVGLAKEGRIAAIPVETRPMPDVDQTLKDLEAGRIVGRVVMSTDTA